MMNNILLINPSASRQLVLIYFAKNKIYQFKKYYHQSSSEILLKLIALFLRRIKVSLRKIKLIVVVRGPGPFSVIRNGVVIANTLAWALAIPILGIKQDDYNNLAQLKKLIKKKDYKKTQVVSPFYSQEPNITYPKN